MQENTAKDHLPLCPICRSVLTKEMRSEGDPEKTDCHSGWNCRCGEFVPDGLQVPPRIEQAPPCGGQKPKSE